MKKEWVDLTDYQILALYFETWLPDMPLKTETKEKYLFRQREVIKLAKLVSEKLREKNA
jgi:hypothetical protein